jgi:hypothetical protein
LTKSLGFSAVVLALSVPAIVEAADPSAKVRKRLAAGRVHYEEQEYRKAIRELAPVARDPAATRAQKLEALELLGLCHFILGEEASAREAFEDLLAIDPDYELREDSDSPKIRKFFRKVKKEYVPDASGERAGLEHAAPSGATAGRRVELEARVTSGQDLVRDLTVHWRRDGELAYRDTPMRNAQGDRWRARFTPPADNAGYTLEYWLDARDIAGRTVARNGGPETPLTLRVAGAPGRERAWYSRWYVWAGAGAVVVGAAALGVVAASGDDAPSGSLPPGTVTLP